MLFILFFIWRYGGNYNIYLLPPSPKQYGEFALNRMDNLGLYTKSKEWATKKQEVSAEIAKVKTIDETIEPLQDALKVAAGKHGSIYSSSTDSNHSEIKMPTAKIKNDILFLTIPTFLGDASEGKKYAEIIAKNLYKTTYKGIVLDFQNNNGGDMGPMVSGLAPILPDGKLIEFINKDNQATSVTLTKGVVRNGGTSVSINNKKKIDSIPVAILMNEWTGSSAEITVLCFANNPNVRLFGKPTAGYTSANSQVNLYDGRVLQITSAKLKDARGQIYENDKILPNVESSAPSELAVNWINNN